MSPAPAHPAYAEHGCTCNALRRLTRTVTRLYDVHLARAGLKTTQYSLLRAVSAEPLPVAALAARLAVERTTLTRNLRPLEEQGLVALAPEGRHRSRTLTLTKAGAAALRDALPLWESAQRRMKRRLGEARWISVHATLGELAHEAYPQPTG